MIPFFLGERVFVYFRALIVLWKGNKLVNVGLFTFLENSDFLKGELHKDCLVFCNTLDIGQASFAWSLSIGQKTQEESISPLWLISPEEVQSEI